MNKFKKILKNCYESFLWIGFLILIADFVTKQVVLHNMIPGSDGQIDIIKGFFYFEYVVNDGMAFGINFNFKDAALANQIIFIIISVIGAVIISLIIIKNYKKLNRLMKASLGMMLAGCLGNLIDRAFYSQSYLNSFKGVIETNGVVDFIAFDFGSYGFPRFNIADSSLVIGTIIIIIYLIASEINDARERAKLEKANESDEKLISKDEMVMDEAKQNDVDVKEDIKE